MNVERPSWARRSFSAAKSGSDMYTSPRISTSAGGSGSSSRSGIAGIVFRLCVTSSPTSPLPRVALEMAVAVDERDREAVDLRLDDIFELGIVDALARQVVAHPLDPCPQL